MKKSHYFTFALCYQYYQYEFPEGVNMVIVKANSEDTTCAYFSIQTADVSEVMNVTPS